MRITAGSARGRPLATPAGATRPTADRVRLALFSMLDSLGASLDRVLDVYAGSGALGLEALSRGAEWVDFVEQNGGACSVIRRNLQTLGFQEQARVYQMTAQRALTALDKPYTLVFLDPPYDDEHSLSLAAELADSALVEDLTVVSLEHSARKAAPEQLGDFRVLRERRYGDTMVTLYGKGGPS